MWEFLSNVWNTASDYAGIAYDSVSDYAGEAYDAVVGYDLYDSEFMGSDSTSGWSNNYLGTAIDAVGGFLDIAAAPSKAGMPPSARRRVSAPGSRAGGADYKAGKSNMANLQFGYTPRVQNAITKANSSKVPSIQAAINQMVNYRKGSNATIKLEGAKMPNVASRNKMPSFAPKYYG